MKPVSEKLLSPKLLTEKDFSYESVKELKDAVSIDTCKNIAVTGIYGAGKSSVINTFVADYEKENPDKRILRISLSTFDLEESNKTSNEYENDIEYKLVQQILYRSNPDDIYQSSFHRIHYRSIDSIPRIAVHVILSFVAFIILFEPSFLRIESLYDIYYLILGQTKGEWVNKVFDFISLGWLVYEAYRITAWAIKRLSTLSSVRFKAKDYEVEVSKDSSVFSKMLEELYYFFRAGKYDVVVIEDLDRLRNPSGLFLKIRELNIMINEAYAFRSERKTLKFIYAVKDDLFKSDIRVKFFDYIVPVVPIIDSHNAADYIIERRTDIFGENDSFRHDIPEIVFYIKEMRVLQNVLNEYEIYHKTIFTKQANLSESKLLAMIVYKNLWPENYSLLHSRSSILNQLFDDPKPMVNRLYEEDVNRQSKLENDIYELKKETRSIRKEFVDYLEVEHNIKEFLDAPISYSLIDIIDNDYLFIKLQHNQFNKYVYVDRHNRETGTIDRDFSFEDIEERIDRDGSKILQLSRLRDDIQKKEIDKAIIDRDLAHKMASSYKEILADVDGEKALKCIKEHGGEHVEEDLSKFILTMLRKGYIAEDYYKYISFYYEGAVSAKDSAYINSVLQGRSLAFDYQLDNPEEVRKQLIKEDNYSNSSILNYSFIAYLMKINDPILDDITIVARKNWAFIKGCDIMENNDSQYLKNHVFKNWYDCLRGLFKGDKNSLQDNLQLFFHYCPENVSVDEELKESLSTMYEVIAGGTTYTSASLVASWMVSKEVVFKTLRIPITEYERPLYDVVLKEGLFEITEENLLVIFGKPFEDASFTTISKCGNKALISYLEKNIDRTIKVFPESSVKEEEKYLKNLLVNDKIDREWKAAYLMNQTCILQDIAGMSKDAIDLIVGVGKLKATWENVYSAISNVKRDALKVYIDNNVFELGSLKCELEKGSALVIEKMLFSDNDFLEINNYSFLASSFTTPIEPDDLSDLDNERMTVIVQRGLLVFSESGLDLLESYPKTIIARYIIDNFDKYKDYYEDHCDFCDNSFGLSILESPLTIDQKQYYLDFIAPTELEKDEQYYLYSKKVCLFINEAGVSSNTDIDLVVNALAGYAGNEGWLEKISIINKINSVFKYDEARETKMIDALGGGYPQLNSYYGVLVLDANSQNRELLEYLVKHGHFVNRYYPQEDGRLKVTFKRDPNK